ncbi:GNAT family N-acetyltransferase [Hamadaea tsunoensis]|uniref:GNAT family N-acetyltransferase n=1 Tax=Hamadaea tsunoensis TaxID=53368 RepID=UPI000422B9DC|nr:GNAT family N-acetyltransferase [Hamadaea tsunoensis]
MLRSCRRTGLHLVRTPRLWIISARLSDLAHHDALGSDPAAQHWLGWRTTDIRAALPARVERPLRSGAVLRPSPRRLAFTAVEHGSDLAVAGLSLVRQPDGYLHLGGTVGAAFRGRGYGGEALAAVLDLAHRHFGIREVRAGCEVANGASSRWLSSGGFVPAPGPATHELDNGRTIEARWWVHRDLLARRRCRWLADPL